jgi:alkylation response protein AidB-like acyl-CoA dehydrogenase
MLTPIRVFWRRISMDFELTKSQKEIQKAAREFARGEFDKELALEMDKKHQFPTKIWKKACDLGFVGVHFPEEYSGQDLGVLENIIIADEFCARESGIGSAVISRCCRRAGNFRRCLY